MRHWLSSFVLALAACPCLAHDFWIRPANFQPPADSLLVVELCVGDHGRGELVARTQSGILRFVAMRDDVERAIVGRDGAIPAGAVRVDGPGLVTLGYSSTAKFIELAPEKFESYLLEEGLEGVIEERAKRGESNRPGRERYARCSKSLVRVDGQGAGPTAALGLPLELIPLSDPFAPAQRGHAPALELGLHFEGRPLAGVLVELLPLAEQPGPAVESPVESPGAGPVRARTDEQGRVRLAVPGSGTWLVAAVHMRRTQPGADSDWESWWASLTLQLP